MPSRIYSDYQWLEASLNSFNGSGFADRTSPEAFMESYLAYQRYKRRDYGQEQATRFWQSGLVVAQNLIENSAGPSRQPPPKALKRFARFYPGLE